MQSPTTPEAVVQRRLDAFNTRDVEAFMATYADDARKLQYPATQLACGSARPRQRITDRFREPDLHAGIIHRIVTERVVIDHEEVTRTFPEGAGKTGLAAVCEVCDGKTASVRFIPGTGAQLQDPPSLITKSKDIMIETPRLLLRQMTTDDVPGLLKVFGDAETMRYYPATFDEGRMLAWVEWNMRSYQEHGHGLWAMTLRDTGEVIGDCGLVNQQIQGSPEVEAGYHVRRDLWGQGLATEAVQGCLAYGFTQLGRQRLVSLIHPQNAPSRRVAEKSGMDLDRVVEWKSKPVCVYVTGKDATIPNQRHTHEN